MTTSGFCRTAFLVVVAIAATSSVYTQETLSTTVRFLPSYLTVYSRPTWYVRSDDGRVIRASCFDSFLDALGLRIPVCVESAISLDSGKTWLHETPNTDPDTSVVVDEAGDIQIIASASQLGVEKTEIVSPAGRVVYNRIGVYPHRQFVDDDMVWYWVIQSRDSSQFVGISPTATRLQTLPGYVSTARSGRMVTADIIELDELGTPGLVIRWRYAGASEFDSIVVEAPRAKSILEVTAMYYGTNIVRVRNRNGFYTDYIQEPGAGPERIVKFSDEYSSTQWFASVRGYLFGKTWDNRYIGRSLQTGKITDIDSAIITGYTLPFEVWSNGETTLWSDGNRLFRVSTGVTVAVTPELESTETLRVVGNHIVMPSDVSGRLLITDVIGRSNTVISAEAGGNVEIPNGIIGHIFISLLCPDGSVRRTAAFVR